MHLLRFHLGGYIIGNYLSGRDPSRPGRTLEGPSQDRPPPAATRRPRPPQTQPEGTRRRPPTPPPSQRRAASPATPASTWPPSRPACPVTASPPGCPGWPPPPS